MFLTATGSPCSVSNMEIEERHTPISQSFKKKLKRLLLTPHLFCSNKNGISSNKFCKSPFLGSFFVLYRVIILCLFSRAWIQSYIEIL